MTRSGAPPPCPSRATISKAENTLRNLHGDQEVEACALMGSEGVRVYKDYDDQGKVRRHDLSNPKRMLQRTPKTRACATFPVDAAGTRHGSCTAEDLAHRVHASLPAAIADGSWGDGDGVTALRRGTAARSGLIFRGSMQTAAQFLRGEEDFEMAREQNVPLRKLFSPKQNLLNHLKGSDETHGALLELTDDMADVAGGLSKYDGTLFEKHGLCSRSTDLHACETLALAFARAPVAFTVSVEAAGTSSALLSTMSVVVAVPWPAPSEHVQPSAVALTAVVPGLGRMVRRGRRWSSSVVRRLGCMQHHRRDQRRLVVALSHPM